MSTSPEGPRDRGGLHQLAYELSLRALTQQESVLNELRERTGTLLAASSIVASFLGARAIGEGIRWATVVALVAFAVSLLTSLYVLLPKPGLIFALRGSVLFEEEFSDPGGLAETHRRLAYWLEEYRDSNQPIIEQLFVFYRVAALAVLAQVFLWSTDLALT